MGFVFVIINITTITITTIIITAIKGTAVMVMVLMTKKYLYRLLVVLFPFCILIIMNFSFIQKLPFIFVFEVNSKH